MHQGLDPQQEGKAAILKPKPQSQVHPQQR